MKTVARDFEWTFGPKEIIEHPENLGLRRHILSCGYLTQQYDGIIHDYISERMASIENQQYYFNTESFHYSVLHRAQNRINELYQQGQQMEGAYQETIRRTEILYTSSLSWRLTAPLRRLVDLLRR